VIWVIGLLLTLFVLDALRLRGRLAALKVLPATADSPSGQPFELRTAPNVTVSDETRAAACAHAEANGLTVVDLVPGDLSTRAALGLVQLVDTAAYRDDRFTQGRTAEHAFVATADVLERAGGNATDGLSFVRQAMSLKHYACKSTDLAVAPGLSAVTTDSAARMAVLREVMGGGATAVLIGQPILLGLLVWAVLAEPVWGAVLWAVYHLQPLVALSGSAIKPPDLLLTTVLRAPLDLLDWGRLVSVRSSKPPADPVEERRPKYAQLMEKGLDPFFEPRRDTCPICASTELDLCLKVSDLFQYKPGHFRLDRCRGCAHVFQNPRLTVEGLNFYYGDFYDGLGEAGLEAIFAYSADPYLVRARMMEGIGVPTKWLDVGTGHGHFCCAARDVWPDTTFDGLDLSESIEEAQRRRWVDNGFRGLFPELADEHRGAYDVVSMSHYLEHTREPAEELAAASKVLAPGGHLLIEVPDPDCRTGRLFGRFWLPWFQPQHQHFLSVKNLERLFAEHGFEAVTWHRGEAHQPVDLLFAAMIAFGLLSPKPKLPWQPRPTVWRRIMHGVVWTVGTPMCLLAWGLDQALAPLMRRPGRSNTYRVLARRTA